MNNTELYIFVKDNNKFNKDLFIYLNKNQKIINNNNIILKPILIETNVIDKYIKMGITKIPSILHNNKIISGYSKIINYINKLSKNTNIENKINDEDIEINMKNYMLDEALKKENDDIEEVITPDELYNNRFDNRTNGKNTIIQKKNSMSNYNINNYEEDDNINNEEDELLLKHLKNNPDINL